MQITYKTRLIATAALLAVTVTTSGCGKKQAPPPQAGPPEVGVVTIQPQRVAVTTELPGRTSAYLVAEVRPQVNGIIQKRVFTEGSEVKAGQVLYQIDPATYQAAFSSAKAAEARAEANLIPARLKEERFRDLVKIKAVSQQDYDDAYAGLKQSEADVASAKAVVETARINLAYTKVTAPISGRIGKSSVTTGALVTANQPAALSTIQQLHVCRCYPVQRGIAAPATESGQRRIETPRRSAGEGQAAVRRWHLLSCRRDPQIFRCHG